MQFKVPQFLEIEDKIFGPFTFREFAYLAGGAGFCFIIYKILGLVLGSIPILAVAGFSVALTFYRPNDKPFINMIESGFKYFSQNKLYVWKKAEVKKKNNTQKGQEEDQNKLASFHEMRLNGSKLRDLAWSLDVLDLSKENKS